MYSATQPTSLKADGYTENDIMDFIVKIKPGRAIVAGSMRVSGLLNVQVNRKVGGLQNITIDDKLHLDPLVGIHSVFRSINTQNMNSTLENIQGYGRNVSMARQAQYDMNTINSSAMLQNELCSISNVYPLLGNIKRDDKHYISFSCLPQFCLNMANDNLHQSKFPNVQVSFTLANGIEAFYTDLLNNSDYMAGNSGYTDIKYTLQDVKLEWIEVAQATATPVDMLVKHLFSQTINNETSYLNVSTPQMYNSISTSFIEQSKRNSIFHNNLLCEKVKGLDLQGGALQILINSQDTIIPYEIKDYEETAFNYLKSLNGNPLKNMITNEYLNNLMSFGIGFQLLTSSNDRLAINLKINSDAYPNNTIPAMDAFIYINSFISM